MAQAIPERVRSGADLKIGRRPVTWDWSKGGITQPECGGPWVHSRSLHLSCSLIGSSVLRTLSRRAQRSEQLLAPRTRPCPVGVWHRFELTRSLPDLHTLQIRPSDVRLCVSDHGNQASESGSFQNPPDPSSSRTSFWRVRLESECRKLALHLQWGKRLSFHSLYGPDPLRRKGAGVDRLS